MYIDYRDTGLFKKDMLKQIGELTGVKYVAQLKPASFSQGNRDRFEVLGMRIIETKKADLRLVLQIWNTSDGAIAWETVEELSSFGRRSSAAASRCGRCLRRRCWKT